MTMLHLLAIALLAVLVWLLYERVQRLGRSLDEWVTRLTEMKADRRDYAALVDDLRMELKDIPHSTDVNRVVDDRVADVVRIIRADMDQVMLRSKTAHRMAEDMRADHNRVFATVERYERQVDQLIERVADAKQETKDLREQIKNLEPTIDLALDAVHKKITNAVNGLSRVYVMTDDRVDALEERMKAIEQQSESRTTSDAQAPSDAATNQGEQATDTGEQATDTGEQATDTGEQATDTGEQATDTSEQEIVALKETLSDMCRLIGLERAINEHLKEELRKAEALLQVYGAGNDAGAKLIRAFTSWTTKPRTEDVPGAQPLQDYTTPQAPDATSTESADQQASERDVVPSPAPTSSSPSPSPVPAPAPAEGTP